ncbi:C6 finger domain-containing protein [Rutstroemia sp. NJR-2017a BVV2]|nr:C6 finger domain-containing protein [Rutstroemia sp. NJR-2017a BVV2]
MSHLSCDAGSAINPLTSSLFPTIAASTESLVCQESTLKRHGYYCRSRRIGNTTRPRACISCARGKVGCDHRRPKCSRCITKAIECHYSMSTPRTPGPETPRSHEAPTEQQGRMQPSASSVPGIGNSLQEKSSASDMDMINDSALGLPDLDFANLEWDGAGIDFASVFDLQEANDSNFSSPGLSPSLLRSAPSSEEARPSKKGFSFQNSSIPIGPTLAVRSLIQRPTVQSGAQKITKLIFHNLKSYPLMMLRQNSLPPFIHHSLVSSNVENGHMESLSNCISLVHMISSGVRGSRKLFWENVRRELEQVYEKHLELSKWELLAAMQALSIYILIRLDEGETDYNNFDYLLVKTVTHNNLTASTTHAIRNVHYATRDSKPAGKSGSSENQDEGQTSTYHMLGVVYRVFNMLMYFEPAAMCDMPTDLILAPLPARKLLWEAGDEFAWRAESQREPRIQVSFGLAADGDIVKLDESRLSCSDMWLSHHSSDSRTPSRSTASWEEWCAGADGFGALVMLAASLIV